MRLGKGQGGQHAATADLEEPAPAERRAVRKSWAVPYFSAIFFTDESIGWITALVGKGDHVSCFYRDILAITDKSNIMAAWIVRIKTFWILPSSAA